MTSTAGCAASSRSRLCALRQAQDTFVRAELVERGNRQAQGTFVRADVERGYRQAQGTFMHAERVEARQ